MAASRTMGHLQRAAATLVVLAGFAGTRAEAAGEASTSSLSRPPWARLMDAFLQAELSRFPGALGICVVDVRRQELYGHREDAPMYLASGVKLAFMIAVFRALEEGELTLDTKLPYTADDVRDGAPRINPRRIGSRFSVANLLHWMMRRSDNAASDLFVDRLGLTTITEALYREGLYGFTPLTRLIEVRRGIYRALDPRADDLSPMEIRRTRWTQIWNPQIRRLEGFLGKPRGSFDRDALLSAYDRFYATGVNRAPMRTVAQIFQKMLSGTLVSERASRAMLEVMSGARTSRNRLLGRLPRGLDVAHKTGSQYLHFCDLGVVFLPVPAGKKDRSNPLIVSMCTERAPLPAAEALMARTARRAYDLAMGARSL